MSGRGLDGASGCHPLGPGWEAGRHLSVFCSAQLQDEGCKLPKPLAFQSPLSTAPQGRLPAELRTGQDRPRDGATRARRVVARLRHSCCSQRLGSLEQCWPRGARRPRAGHPPALHPAPRWAAGPSAPGHFLLRQVATCPGQAPGKQASPALPWEGVGLEPCRENGGRATGWEKGVLRRVIRMRIGKKGGRSFKMSLRQGEPIFEFHSSSLPDHKARDWGQ